MLALNKNLVAGGLIFAFGAFYAGHALATLQLGTFAAMGPGLFPVCVGAVLAVLGALIVLADVRRARAAAGPQVETWERIEWRSLLAVVAAMSAFAVTIALFGVIPAIFAIVAVAALASDKLRPLTVLALSAGLSLAAWLIFTLALKLPLPLFRWPL